MRKRLTLLPLFLTVLLTGCNSATTNASSSAPAAPNGPAVPSAAHHSGMDHSSMPSMARLQGLSGTEFDAAFASQMIEHHQGAVEMSEMALEASKRDEVKEAARKIIADQKKEIEQMTVWVKEWTGSEPSSEDRQMMESDMRSMMTRFKDECATDCDRAFLTHMKTHHQMAVDMAKVAVEKAEHPELKELANEIIAAQTREMEQFEAWLKEWYS